METYHKNALPSGYQVAEYAIETVLGHGGFGITYLARDTTLGALVAVKEFLPSEIAQRDGTMRVLPNPDLSTPYKPSVCQIIYTEWVLSEGTFWSARGALSFTGASALNPYHTLPILEQAAPLSATNMQGMMMYRGKMTISRVAVLENF